MSERLRTKLIKQIPNTITTARFVLTVAFLIMLLMSPYMDNMKLWIDWAFVLFVYTGLTDAVDGTIARMMGATSKYGRMMDPLADKVLICGAFICFAIIKQPVLFPETLGETGQHIIRWSAAFIIITREGMVTLVRQKAEAKGIQFGANVWGKAKMFFQSFGIGAVVIKMAHVPTAEWGMWFTAITYVVMAIATVMSGIQYFMRQEAKQVGMGI